MGISLINNTLGSVGKKEFSGDIDIALDIDSTNVSKFVKKLEQSPEILDISRSSVIMTKVKIENFDKSKQSSKPRTGYVQVDFMLGDVKWLIIY